MTERVPITPKEFMVYFPVDYYETIIDNSLYVQSSKLENNLKCVKHTNLPIDIYKIWVYLTVEFTLEASKNGLGGSTIFLPCGLEEKCVNTLLNNSSYQNRITTQMCFDLDRKLFDVSYLLSSLQIDNTGPIYLIAPIVLDENLESLMITDLKERRIWTFEPGNSYPNQLNFDKHLQSDDPPTVESMLANSSLYANYFYANNLINYKNIDTTTSMNEQFNRSHRCNNKHFKLAHYLSKDDSSSSHFSLLLIVQLFIQEMIGSDNDVRYGVELFKKVENTIKHQHNEYILIDFKKQLIDTYTSFASQTKKTQFRHKQIGFYGSSMEKSTRICKRRKTSQPTGIFRYKLKLGFHT